MLRRPEQRDAQTIRQDMPRLGPFRMPLDAYDEGRMHRVAVADALNQAAASQGPGQVGFGQPVNALVMVADKANGPGRIVLKALATG